MSGLRDENELPFPRCPIYPDRPRARWVDYAAAIALVGVVHGLVMLADPYFPAELFRVPYVLTIGAIGFAFGLGPTVAALLLVLATYIRVQLLPGFAGWPLALTPTAWADLAAFAFGAIGAGVAMALLRENRRGMQMMANDLAEREAILDAFFSQSPVTLALLDNNLRMRKANCYTARLFGRPVEQIEGKLMSELVPDFESRLAPQLAHVIETGETEKEQMVSSELPGQPGVLKHWLFSTFPISMEDGNTIGIGMIGVEVTDLVRAQEALKRSESRFRTVFDRAGIGMTVVDIQGKVLAANPAFAEFVGYDLSELPGMKVERYAYPEDAPAANELLREMVGGKRESFQSEKRYVRKDGSIVWGRLTATIARGPDTEQPYIIGMIEDISDRVRAVSALLEEQKHKLEFYRRTIMAATAGKLIITELEAIEALDGTTIKSWDIADPRDVQKTRHEARSAALETGLGETRAVDFATAVGEAVTNAVKHAGGGKASLLKRNGSILFIISDRGPGIEALSLPAVALERGYTTTGTLGMGFKLMIEFNDRVYLATGPEGTTVALETGPYQKVDALLSPFVDTMGMEE